MGADFIQSAVKSRSLYYFKKVSRCNSSNACWSSESLFMTMGPRQAIVSLIWLPPKSISFAPSVPAVMVSDSPRVKRAAWLLSTVVSCEVTEPLYR